MDNKLSLTLLLLGVCVFFFVRNKPRMDIVALVAMLALPLLGILEPSEVFSGFSDQSVILIGLMFVIGEGLVRTGVSTDIGAWISKKAGGSETKLIAFMMIAVCVIGSFMSSTGIVAIFIPIVLGISKKLNVSPSKLMMPLCFAGLISGMMSLVATPPNMIMDSILRREGFAGFSFFSFTPMGIIVLAAGVFYMLYARRFLGKHSDGEDDDDGASKTTFVDLAHRYKMTWRDTVLVIEPGSPFCGKEIRDLPLRAKHSANVVCIERKKGVSRQFIDPVGETRLQPRDAMLIDFTKPGWTPDDLCKLYNLRAYPMREGDKPGKYFQNSEREFGLVEVSVMPNSPLEGHSPAEANFRTHYGMSVAGIIRNQTPISENVAQEKLRVGDMLLLIGSWKAAEKLNTHSRSLIVLNMPVESENKTAVPGHAIYSIISLVIMVALMITGTVPNALAALIGCLLLLATRCIDIDRAYRCINWSSLILIVGMIPFATALEKTGGIEAASNMLLHVFGQSSPRIILGALMAFTMFVGLFVSNTVTAVLLAPVAITVSRTLGIEPYTFAMGIAIAASCAFMTPISSPVNTLVLGPGRYRFVDFLRFGVPFSAIILVLGMIFIPLFFPFRQLDAHAEAATAQVEPATPPAESVAVSSENSDGE